MAGFWFDKDDPLYKDFVKELEAAYWRGYSVIELQRILSFSNSTNLYRIMREENIVARIGRQAYKYKLPNLFENCLRKAGLGFPQWCNSHGIDDFRMAAIALLHGNPKTQEEIQVFRAYRLDFRTIFDSFYKDSDRYDVYDPPIASVTEQLASKVGFDKDQKLYVGNIFLNDGGTISVSGKSMKYATAMVRKKCVLLANIAKLSVLPRRS